MDCTNAFRFTNGLLSVLMLINHLNNYITIRHKRNYYYQAIRMSYSKKLDVKKEAATWLRPGI
jgi:hypothetical protein